MRDICPAIGPEPPCSFANIVKSIANKKNVTVLNIRSTRMFMVHGFLRRIYFTAGCASLTSILNSSPLNPIITPFLPIVSNPALCP